jgi:hypothetical protein
MDGYFVSSNSTGLVHSEQMVSLGGKLIWQDSPDELPSIENGTTLKLSGVALLRRRLSGGKWVDESCWIGELAPGDKSVVRFMQHQDNRRKLAAARELSPLTRRSRSEGALSLRPLVRVAEDHEWLEAGDVRLVGWCDQSMAGIQVLPAADEVRKAMLVVAHLQFGASAPRPDWSLRAEPKPTADDAAAQTEATPE